MKKSIVLSAFLFCAVLVFGQNKFNPKTGKKEIQVDAMFFQYQSLAVGLEGIYRIPVKKSTKVGAGGLFSYEFDRYLAGEAKRYGALFADVTQFAGKRQKWSLSAQAGHGIYKTKIEGEDAYLHWLSTTTAGFYYSASANYRPIISKNLLMSISLFWQHRNFRYRYVVEYFSPHSVDRGKDRDLSDDLGLKIGLIF